MKKIIFVALAALCLSAFSASAESYAFNKGYRGNVGLGFGNMASAKLFEGWADLETNHGYSFGNGLYVGGGLGCFTIVDSKIGLIPIYAEAKFNFLNFLVSPFVDARIGALTSVNTETKRSNTSFLFAPMVGVDIWRFSLGFTYGITTFKAEKPTDAHYMGLTLFFNW